MAGFGFRKNTVFEWNAIRFRIREIPPNGEVVLEATDTGTMTIVTRQHLLAEYGAGRISAAADTESGQPATVYSRPLNDLPPAMLEKTQRRYRYLQAIYKEGRPIFTREYLEPILQRFAAELGDPKPPSITSVYRWHRRYQASQDARTLIPRFDRRGRRQSRQSERVLQLVGEAVSEAFKASPLATGKNIYSRLLTKINAHNSRSLPIGQVVPPSMRTVYRILGNADLYEMVRLREGKSAADRRFRISLAGVRTQRILERVEMDHTPLDLFLIDERTWLPIGRPTLTMLIDHYSRMPIGYYLSFGDPSAAAIVGALRHAILPKIPAADSLPGLQVVNAWPCYGVPEVLVVDNGLEFLGNTLDRLSMDLGVRIEFCPARQPRFKGTIERHLKRVNYDFAHQLPGTSFARFHQRGEYEPDKHAVLTLADFTQIFEKWLLDDYAQSFHRGIGTTPMQRWKDGLCTHEPELPADLRVLEQRIGESKTRKLRHDGFELNNIRYNSHVLLPIIRRFGEGVEIRVVFNPEDLGEVQVWGPDDFDPVTVPALDLQFARGLSARQVALIAQLAREQGGKTVDVKALQRAREDIASEIEKLASSRKLKARRRSAAIKGTSSSNPNPSFPGPVSPSKAAAKAEPQRSPKKVQKGTLPLTPSSRPKILSPFVIPPKKNLDHES